MAVSYDHERGRYCVELPMTSRQMAEKEAAAKSRRTQGATTQGETKVPTDQRAVFVKILLQRIRISTAAGTNCWYLVSRPSFT